MNEFMYILIDDYFDQLVFPQTMASYYFKAIIITHRNVMEWNESENTCIVWSWLPFSYNLWICKSMDIRIEKLYVKGQIP